jgi:hypothetical protein
MALCKYYAYDEKDKKPHQLEKLKPGNIVNEFYLFQSSCRFSGIFPDYWQITLPLSRGFPFFTGQR